MGIKKIENPILWGLDGINLNEHNDGAFILAKNGKEIIGYCMLWINKDEKWEVGFGILPEYHRQGIGTKLLGKVLFRAKELEINEIIANPKKMNLPSISFLKANGFKQVAEDEKHVFLKREI